MNTLIQINSESGWVGIAAFLFFMWALTLWICVCKLKIRKENNSIEELSRKLKKVC